MSIAEAKRIEAEVLQYFSGDFQAAYNQTGEEYYLEAYSILY